MLPILFVVLNIVILLLILTILIGIHELGHFLMAKLCGVRVDEFAIGMGPRIFSKKFGETEYSINLLPIGGYVKILGENDDPEVDMEALKDHPGNFQNKHPLQKILILFGGVLFNLVTAIVIFYVLFGFAGYKPEVLIDRVAFGQLEKSLVVENGEPIGIPYSVADGGSAKEAGWPESGFIKKLNGEQVKFFSDELPAQLAPYRSQEISATICTDYLDAATCGEYKATVNEEGRVGVYTAANYANLVVYPGNQRYLSGVLHSANVVYTNVEVVKLIFQQARATGDYQVASIAVSSPIPLYFVIDSVRSQGIVPLAELVALLSITLFIMNLLPIPALDGGRILLVLPELITGKRINRNFEAWAIRISFILLMILMLGIIFKDILMFGTFREFFGK